MPEVEKRRRLLDTIRNLLIRPVSVATTQFTLIIIKQFSDWNDSFCTWRYVFPWTLVSSRCDVLRMMTHLNGHAWVLYRTVKFWTNFYEYCEKTENTVKSSTRRIPTFCDDSYCSQIDALNGWVVGEMWCFRNCLHFSIRHRGANEWVECV